ncbi:MAG: AbrB/MazE/SpoVT family DNA-binding domain-containing protein [Coriobacteriia bacterium]|nr:AbrB/MazE/SpoVT family DNA-binding domain-containing protein [Coriobacteriia bacterium]
MLKARKVGNSITVTIPKDVVAELGITEGTEMNVFVREDTVVMQPALSKWDRLVARVRREAADRGLAETDVDQAVSEIRAGKRRGASPKNAG